ncbi:hypothetical protein WDU94_014562 [Cyamophila willieti]
MKETIFFVLAVLFFLVCHLEATERPIIGILTQEPCLGVDKHFADFKSYIPASYVKAVEASGARVAPIFIGNQEVYYRKILSQVNGVLIPGGGASFYAEDGYAKAGAMIYKIAKEFNENRDYFPVMGICLGFQLLLYTSNNENELRTRCDCFYENLALEFMPSFRQSLLYSRAPIHVLQELATSHITHNWHMWCITPSNFTDNGLAKEWKVLSTNSNNRGLKFISSVEHKVYPFAGIQFHPEKNAYEWKLTQDNPHTRIAIENARYFFDWLVSQASGSHHSFETEEEEKAALIYNYCPEYTAYIPGIGYDQTYLFKNV